MLFDAFTMTNEELEEKLCKYNGETPDIIMTIVYEVESDMCNESDKLLDLYKRSTHEQKALIDEVLIDICGWSLKSILDRTVNTI